MALATPDLISQVLNELELGVLVCHNNMDHVLFANLTAREALQCFGWLERELPKPLSQLIRSCGQGTPLQQRFAPALSITASNGRQFFVRAKQMNGANGVLITISAAVIRQSDLITVLTKQFGLSRRECEIVELVRLGYRNQEVGEHMKLAVTTVKTYLGDIFAAMGVRNRTELAAMVERLTRKE